MAFVKPKYIDLSAAPWTMHEFFAGSGSFTSGSSTRTSGW